MIATARYRRPDLPADRAVNQAALAWATDGFLIGTAMLPHEGVGQDRAHVDLSTGVIDHTLTFHRPLITGIFHKLADAETGALIVEQLKTGITTAR